MQTQLDQARNYLTQALLLLEGVKPETHLSSQKLGEAKACVDRAIYRINTEMKSQQHTLKRALDAIDEPEQAAGSVS
jgi:hypothetical protein